MRNLNKVRIQNLRIFYPFNRIIVVGISFSVFKSNIIFLGIRIVLTILNAAGFIFTVYQDEVASFIHNFSSAFCTALRGLFQAYCTSHPLSGRDFLCRSWLFLSLFFRVLRGSLYLSSVFLTAPLRPS